MAKKNLKEFMGIALAMVFSFIFIGAGLNILFNSKGDFGSVIGGFALIGIAIAIIYKIIEDG